MIDEDRVKIATILDVTEILESLGYTVQLLSGTDIFDVEVNATRADTGTVYLNFQYETIARVKEWIQKFLPLQENTHG